MAIQDIFNNDNILVDKMLGRSYDVVKKVYLNLDTLNQINENQNINTLVENYDEVKGVLDVADDIKNVSSNMPSINSASTYAAQAQAAVASAQSEVANAKSAASQAQTYANNAADTVSVIEDNIDAINTVSENIEDVKIVAQNKDNMDAVIQALADSTAVSNANTVVTNIDSLNTVADNINTLVSVAEDLIGTGDLNSLSATLKEIKTNLTTYQELLIQLQEVVSSMEDTTTVFDTKVSDGVDTLEETTNEQIALITEAKGNIDVLLEQGNQTLTDTQEVFDKANTCLLKIRDLYHLCEETLNDITKKGIGKLMYEADRQILRLRDEGDSEVDRIHNSLGSSVDEAVTDFEQKAEEVKNQKAEELGAELDQKAEEVKQELQQKVNEVNSNITELTERVESVEEVNTTIQEDHKTIQNKIKELAEQVVTQSKGDILIGYKDYSQSTNVGEMVVGTTYINALDAEGNYIQLSEDNMQPVDPSKKIAYFRYYIKSESGQVTYIDRKVEIEAIGDIPTATTEVSGIIELATKAEAVAGTDTTKAVTPEGVKSAFDSNLGAALESSGDGSLVDSIVQLITGNENLIQEILGILKDATTEQKGVVELATAEEVKEGTSTSLVVTVSSLAQALPNILTEIFKPNEGDTTNTVVQQITNTITGDTHLTEEVASSILEVLATSGYATETSAGIIRIATVEEATAGTSDVTTITPAKLKNQLDPVKNQLINLEEDVTATSKAVETINDKVSTSVQFVTQTLTSEQQIQAQKNVGLNAVIATGSTVGRSIQDRFADVVNVKDFGAKGDGVTDDTDALRAAIATNGSVIFFPEGIYKITETVLVNAGQTLLGSGVDYWDTYRPDPTRLLKSVAHGTHLLFCGTGAKVYTVANVSNERTPKSVEGTKCAFTDFTNGDSVGATPATPKSFSAAVVLQHNCGVRNLRILLNYNGIAGYNDDSLLGLGDNWDVGLWVRDGNEALVECVQVCGYWRIAGTLLTENDGSITMKGNPERIRFINFMTQGVRGLLVRNAPQIQVLSNTGNSITIKANSSLRITAFSSCVGVASDGSRPILSFTGSSTDSGGNVVLTGVTPTISGELIAIRYPTSANNFSNTIFLNAWVNSLNHTSKKASTELGLPISFAFEVDGYPIRNLVFVNTKIQTVWDFGNSLFGGCDDFKFIGSEFENGELIAYSQAESPAHDTENLRIVGSMISSSVGRSAFNPRSAYIDSEQFPTKSGSSTFKIQNWREGKLDLCYSNGDSALTFKTDGGFDFHRKGYLRRSFGVDGTSGNIQFYTNAFSIDTLENGAAFTIYASKNVSFGGNINPFNDNTSSIGNGSHRWSQVFVASGTINTSDARDKTSQNTLDDILLQAWDKVAFKAFKFKDAVEKKGDEARLHVGVIAQELQAALAATGIDASKYGLFCYDNWQDEYEDVEVIDQEEVLDENGAILTPKVSHMEKRKVLEAGDRYGIRYEELLCLEAAYQRWRADKLEQRVTVLEDILKMQGIL